MKDNLGDKLKQLEKVEAGRKAPDNQPLMCRIDGKSFSKYTKGLDRPFDSKFSALMVATTEYLVEHSDALLGYCQSDEITLYWFLDKENNSNRQYWFDGKYQKLTSVLASMAGSFFSANVCSFLGERHQESRNYPCFDARVWPVPSLELVKENFEWRMQDCIKNSISMAAHHRFSHKSLQGVSASGMVSRLREEGYPWEDFSPTFKFGTFVQRSVKEVSPEDPSLANINEKYRPASPVLRSFIQSVPASWELLNDHFGRYDVLRS